MTGSTTMLEENRGIWPWRGNRWEIWASSKNLGNLSTGHWEGARLGKDLGSGGRDEQREGHAVLGHREWGEERCGWVVGVKIDVNKKLDALSMEIMASFIALVTPILNAGVFMHCERGKYFVRIWLLKYYIVLFVIAFLFCKSYSQWLICWHTDQEKGIGSKQGIHGLKLKRKCSAFFCLCISEKFHKIIDMQSELAFHAESLSTDFGKSSKIVQSHRVLRFWRINSPAKQRMPWALATTATTMTMTMIRATMTIAITGPLPASGKWNVSKSAFCLFVWKCMAGSSWLSEGKLVTKQTDYQTEALHQVQSSPALSQGQVRKES